MNTTYQCSLVVITSAATVDGTPLDLTDVSLSIIASNMQGVVSESSDVSSSTADLETKIEQAIETFFGSAFVSSIVLVTLEGEELSFLVTIVLSVEDIIPVSAYEASALFASAFSTELDAGTIIYPTFINTCCGDCLKIDAPNCLDIKLPIHLAANTEFSVVVIDAKGTVRSLLATSDSEGNVVIPITEFPNGLFIPNSFFKVQIYDSTGAQVTFSINEKDFTCVDLSIYRPG